MSFNQIEQIESCHQKKKNKEEKEMRMKFEILWDSLQSIFQYNKENKIKFQKLNNF